MNNSGTWSGLANGWWAVLMKLRVLTECSNGEQMMVDDNRVILCAEGSDDAISIAYAQITGSEFTASVASTYPH